MFSLGLGEMNDAVRAANEEQIIRTGWSGDRLKGILGHVGYGAGRQPGVDARVVRRVMVYGDDTGLVDIIGQIHAVVNRAINGRHIAPQRDALL